MDAVLTVVALGRRARNAANINNRQPLARAFVKGPDAAMDAVLAGHFGRLAGDELNVHEVKVAGESVLKDGVATKVDPVEVRAKAAEQAERLHARL